MHTVIIGVKVARRYDVRGPIGTSVHARRLLHKGDNLASERVFSIIRKCHPLHKQCMDPVLESLDGPGYCNGIWVVPISRAQEGNVFMG